jgi:hypothetical protein
MILGEGVIDWIVLFWRDARMHTGLIKELRGSHKTRESGELNRNAKVKSEWTVDKLGGAGARIPSLPKTLLSRHDNILICQIL